MHAPSIAVHSSSLPVKMKMLAIPSFFDPVQMVWNTTYDIVETLIYRMWPNRFFDGDGLEDIHEGATTIPVSKAAMVTGIMLYTLGALLAIVNGAVVELTVLVLC